MVNRTVILVIYFLTKTSKSCYSQLGISYLLQRSFQTHITADTYHTGKELSIIITGHSSRAVELEPAVFASPHTQQTRVHLPRSEHIGKVTVPANNHQSLPHQAKSNY